MTTEALFGLPELPEANSVVLPRVRPQPLPFTSFPIQYSPTTLQSDAKYYSLSYYQDP
jgi:hypothetical protein